MTTAPLDRLQACLIELAAAMKAADTPNMLRSMEQLDELVAAHKRDLDPRLAHFLERRSYAKALEFLGGAADVPRGTCVPKALED
jgi:hypothetical protein